MGPRIVSRGTRRVVRIVNRVSRIGVAAVLAVALTPLMGVSTARAQAYVFWGYFHWSGSAWEFASTGADGFTPDDGAVEGWRYAASGDNTPPRLPRADGDFELICGQTEAETGQKRVAVVIDYGIPEEAPEGAEVPPARGECAVVPESATGADVLAAVADVRGENAMVCGLDGYPAAGCGGESDVEPAPDADQPVELSLPDTATDNREADQGAGRDGDGADEPRAAQPTEGGIGRFGVLIAAVAAIVVLVVIGGLLGANRRRGSN